MEFPGGLGVGILGFLCYGPGLVPVREPTSHRCGVAKKKRENRETNINIRQTISKGLLWNFSLFIIYAYAHTHVPSPECKMVFLVRDTVKEVWKTQPWWNSHLQSRDQDLGLEVPGAHTHEGLLQYPPPVQWGYGGRWQSNKDLWDTQIAKKA